MKNSYEVRAQKFIQKIFPIIKDIMREPYEVEDVIKTFNNLHHRKIRVCYGDARIALLTSDYVVKFDYDYENVEEIGGCENEIELYAQAVEDGFDYLFAKIERYDYNGQSFYIMPRIDHIGEYRNLFHYADYYMTNKERCWCEDHNLTDLHCNNYGFRNGRICIVDYAYINSDSDWEIE